MEQIGFDLIFAKTIILIYIIGNNSIKFHNIVNLIFNLEYKIVY